MSLAADKSVAGDGGVSEQNSDDAEHTRGLVVSGFEQVGNGELGELACARRDEVDQQQPGPAAAALPERYEAMSVGIFRAPQQ